MLTAAYVIGGGFAAVALACLGLLAWHWRTAGRHLGDWWAKAVATAAQLLTAFVALASSYLAGTDKGDWLPPAALAAAAAALWKLVEILADSRVKAAEKADKKELAAAEAEGERWRGCSRC